MGAIPAGRGPMMVPALGLVTDQAGTPPDLAERISAAVLDRSVMSCGGRVSYAWALGYLSEVVAAHPDIADLVLRLTELGDVT